MVYGDYNGPNKPDKGHEGGSCNVTRCQAPNALYFNHGSHSWYCHGCMIQIGGDTFNKRDWEANYQPRYGHPMFETREQFESHQAVGVRGYPHEMSDEQKARFKLWQAAGRSWSDFNNSEFEPKQE